MTEPKLGLLSGDLSGSDEDEVKKVAELRDLVQAHDPDATYVDDLTLRRFLRSRNLNVQKASNSFLEHLKWRRIALPDGFISKAEIRNELAQQKMFMQGIDKKGCPIGVVLGCRHYPSKNEPDEFKRFVVYAFERLCSRMKVGVEKFAIIADLEGWGYSNLDIRGYLAALEILQNNYPERLGKLFGVNSPFLFSKAWKIMYPFIDENTKKKIVFVDDTNLKATLLEEIDVANLPEKYGGSLKLVPI